jgi:bifunctional enzyme CysN/CysC
VTGIPPIRTGASRGPGSADETAGSLLVAILGAAGHGKSTLAARLAQADADLPEAELEAAAPGRITLPGKSGNVVLVDAPGQRALLDTLTSDAALGDAALLVVDAGEGVSAPTRRCGYLAHLLGIREAVVAVNAMDQAGYSADRFAEVERDIKTYLEDLGVTPAAVIPVCATGGDNVVERAAAMPWYDGPTLREALERLRPGAGLRALPLRIAIEDVGHSEGRRVIAGRLESGRLAVGDAVLFSPSNRTGLVKSIEAPGAGGPDTPPQTAEAGQPVRFSLEDQVVVERGEIASHTEQRPMETNVFRGRLIWLGATPLAPGRRLTLARGTTQAPVMVERVERAIDTNDLSTAAAETLESEAVGEVMLRTRAILALDAHTDNPRTGRFSLFDGDDPVAVGLVDMEGYPDQRRTMTVKSTNVSLVEHGVVGTMRVARNGHAGGVLWFTGLSGSGKSTLAIELEQRLFQRGYQVYVLDGDNVRQGLNANLGFSPDDRAENIRRVGEVAALFADAGIIVISAFISPYRSDRARARQAAGERFREVHIQADIETCERRDPKGLYARARAGEIADFTGISAPYEVPDDPDLVVDTAAWSVDDSVRALTDFVEREFELTKDRAADRRR